MPKVECTPQAPKEECLLVAKGVRLSCSAKDGVTHPPAVLRSPLRGEGGGFKLRPKWDVVPAQRLALLCAIRRLAEPQRQVEPSTGAVCKTLLSAPPKP